MPLEIEPAIKLQPSLFREVSTPPDLPLTADRLDRVMGWNRSTNQPLTLREFIAAKAPVQALKLGIESKLNLAETIVSVKDLTVDEQRKAAIAEIEQRPDITGVTESWTGKKVDNVYLRELVESDVRLGSIVHRFHFLEGAALAGVIRIVSKEEHERLGLEQQRALQRKYFQETTI